MAWQRRRWLTPNRSAVNAAAARAANVAAARAVNAAVAAAQQVAVADAAAVEVDVVAHGHLAAAVDVAEDEVAAAVVDEVAVAPQRVRQQPSSAALLPTRSPRRSAVSGANGANAGAHGAVAATIRPAKTSTVAATTRLNLVSARSETRPD